MADYFESDPTHSDAQILNDLEFTAQAPTIEEQQLALIDLQQSFVAEWRNDPNGFMVRVIDRLHSEIDTGSRLTHLYLGLRYTDDALGVRTEEAIVHVHSKRILPNLTPGSTPRIQRIDRNIPIVSIREGDKKVARYFEDTDAILVQNQIDRLRQLQILCPNLNDDLMTITPTPGKELTRLWRSNAYLSSRPPE